MNAKSISLFFILFVLAAAAVSPRPRAARTPRTAPTTDLDTLLGDLTLTNQQVVRRLTDSIQDYFSTDLRFDDAAPSKQLSSLMSYKTYLFDLLETSEVDVTGRVGQILAGLPTFEVLDGAKRGTSRP